MRRDKAREREAAARDQGGTDNQEPIHSASRPVHDVLDSAKTTICGGASSAIFVDNLWTICGGASGAISETVHRESSRSEFIVACSPSYGLVYATAGVVT